MPTTSLTMMKNEEPAVKEENNGDAEISVVPLDASADSGKVAVAGTNGITIKSEVEQVGFETSNISKLPKFDGKWPNSRKLPLPIAGSRWR